MEKMHCNKQHDNVIINDKTAIKFIPSITKTDTEIFNDGETSLSFIEENDNKRNTIKLNEASNIGTTSSCTSSTDSGVNVSDNDDVPPSPTSSHLHSFPSSTSSSSETTSTILNSFNQQFHKNNKNTKRDNNNINNYNKHIFNGDNNDEPHHNDEVDKNSSADSDNKLKCEQHQKREQHLSQQFSKVENKSNNGSNSTRYRADQRDIIESVDKSRNISHQPNLATLESSATPTIITATSNNDRTSLQYNEFIKPSRPPQRSPSTTSSLSLPSSAISDDPPFTMHNFNGSPVVSIRSIDSIIIPSDSDSDLNSDSEDGHNNYVIKKLGTQVSYPPNHPNIPNINSGHKVVNQKVVPQDDNVVAGHLAALAAIGDSIGAAQALGPVPSLTGVPQRPQIGSLAVSNSSDITFGDKHFYEGPVTIQQFLIDSRDKWKEADGKENPSFMPDNAETSKNAKDTQNSSTKSSSKLCGYISKRKKFIIPGVLAVLALLIVATIFGIKGLDESKNTDDDSKCSGNGTLCLIERDVWRAHPQKKKLDQQKELPLKRVIISHTASEACDSIQICSDYIRVIQEFHMNSLGWDDIGYNFLIGSDGRVYKGRGWDAIGAHTKGYNTGSVGITFIGTYTNIKPTDAQLKACLELLDEGLRLKKLTPDYHVYGARQFQATESPGEKLYTEIKKWPHWSPNI